MSRRPNIESPWRFDFSTETQRSGEGGEKTGLKTEAGAFLLFLLISVSLC